MLPRVQIIVLIITDPPLSSVRRRNPIQLNSAIVKSSRIWRREQGFTLIFFLLLQSRNYLKPLTYVTSLILSKKPILYQFVIWLNYFFIVASVYSPNADTKFQAEHSQRGVKYRGWVGRWPRVTLKGGAFRSPNFPADLHWSLDSPFAAVREFGLYK